MPTETRQRQWASHRSMYLCALKRYSKSEPVIQMIDDDEVEVVKHGSPWNLSMLPATVSMQRFYGGGIFHFAGHGIPEVPPGEFELTRLMEEVPSDSPIPLWAPWEILSVTQKGQSGAPVCDRFGNVIGFMIGNTIGVMSEGLVLSMQKEIGAGGTSAATPIVSGMAAVLLAAKSRLWSTKERIQSAGDVDVVRSSFLKFALHRAVSSDRESLLRNWVRWRVRVNRGNSLASLADSPRGIQKIDWSRNPEQILDRITQTWTQPEERVAAVLFAETTAFSEDLQPRLLAGLGEFIEQKRFHRDEETATAVGSAIRKYAMNMGESHFDSYAKWLLPSQTEALGHEVELELTKSVSWRLIYEPLTTSAEHPHLLRVLIELCSSYLTPRLILQKNYASTVLHGIVAVVVLEAAADQGSQGISLINAAVQMNIRWFTEMLSDRIADAIENISEHSPKLANRVRVTAAFQLARE